jgi:hypothetical protein
MYKTEINFLTLNQIKQIIYSQNPLDNLPINIGFIDCHNKKIILSIMYKFSYVSVDRGSYCLYSSGEIEQKRKKLQLMIIENIYLEALDNGINDTITNNMKSYRAFFYWKDKNNILLNDTFHNYRQLFSLYTQYLTDSYIRGKIQQNTSSRHQAIIRDLLNKVDIRISEHISIISQTTDYDNIEPYSVKDFSLLINFYFNTFDQLSDVVLNFKPFPFKFNYFNKHTWIFTTFSIEDPIAAKPGNHGEIFQRKSELFASVHHNLSLVQCNLALNQLKNNLKYTNSDKYNSYRISLARVAMKTYLGVFLLETGMNESTALNLTLDNIYIRGEKKEISIYTTKPRANNKKVDFQLSNHGYKRFIIFFKLRNYLLGSYHIDNLFFLQSKVKARPFSSLSGAINSKVFKQFKELPVLQSRKTRLNKGHTLYEEFGYKVAADALQHSLNVHFNNYSNTTYEEMTKQISNYFDQFNKNLTGNNDQYFCNKITTCNTKQITTDTDKATTCFNCKYYILHCDTIDIGKLLANQLLLSYIKSKNRLINTFIENTKKQIEDKLQIMINNNSINTEFLSKQDDYTIISNYFDDYFKSKYEIYKLLEVI